MMMDKLLFWKIRSINSQNAFERLIDLKKRNKLVYIALVEPFQGLHELDMYRKKLGMDKAIANSSFKIWVFWKEEWEDIIVMDKYQQVTILFHNQSLQKEVVVTVV